MNKKMKKIPLILAILLTLNGCTHTINGWNKKISTEYLEIYGQDELPSQLEAKKVQYRCVDLVYSTSGNTKKCYVTKDSSVKLEGWSARLYETSKGFLFDTGEKVVILGVLMLCGMSGGHCENLDFSGVKVK